jgi:hypothetical protein
VSRSSVPTPARWIDPRGQRFGAALSAVILSIAIALAAVWLAALTGIALGVSAAFGTRYFVLGRPWPAVRSAMKLGPPAAPEHEYPPRFAQALGATFVGLGTGLLAVGVSPWGWLPTIAVVVLQVVLATTGYCLGCRLYFVRWYAPALFTRLIRRQVRAAR